MYDAKQITSSSSPTPPRHSKQSGFVDFGGAIDTGKEIGEIAQKEGKKLYQNLINRFSPIEELVNRAKKEGANIPAGENAKFLARAYLGIGKKIESVLNDSTISIDKNGNITKTGEGLKPIIDDIESRIDKNPYDITKDLKDFMVSKRTINDLQRPKFEGSNDNIVSQSQVNDAQNKLAQLSKKYGTDISIFEDTASRLYDYQRRVLYMLVDSGNMSKEMYDRIVKLNPNYIPFDRVLEEDIAGGTPVNKKRFSGAKSPIKKIKGSEKEIEDVIGSIIKNTATIIDRADRNKVSLSIAKMKDIFPDEISPVKAKMMPIKLSKSESADEKTIFRQSQFVPKGNIIEYYEDGKRKYIEVNKNVYEAMTGLNEETSGLLIKLLSAPANILRHGATLTPEFIARNPIRDQYSAWLQTSVGFKPFIDPMLAIADIVKKTDIYNEWLQSGGAYSGFVELNRKAVNKAAKELTKRPSVLRRLNIVADMQDLSQLMEQATRLGVYKAARRKGLSPIESGYESRESTTDFARRGDKVKGISSAIPFLNAGVQGSERSFRAFRKDPIGLTIKGLVAITIPSILLYLLNRDDEEYKEMESYKKALFWNFKIKGQWYRVPKPFLYGQIFGTMPEKLMEYIDSKDKNAMKLIKDIAFNSAEAVSPISGDPASGLLPTAIKPIIEVNANKNFFTDRDIVPQSKQDRLPSEQYTKYTSETAKLAGKVLNTSPAKLEHLLKGYLGGSAQYILDGTDFLVNSIKEANGEKIQKERPVEITDLPLIRGFTSKPPKSGNAQSIQDFYDNIDSIDALYNTYRDYIKIGRKEDAGKLLKKHPELAYGKITADAREKMSILTKRIDSIIASEIPDSEKRKEIDKIENLRLDFAKKMNAGLTAKKIK
jgi:hypothetical protein